MCSLVKIVIVVKCCQHSNLRSLDQLVNLSTRSISTVESRANAIPTPYSTTSSVPNPQGPLSAPLHSGSLHAPPICGWSTPDQGGKKAKKTHFRSTPEVVAVTPGLIITTAPGTEKIQTRSRGAPSTRGHAGSVSLHAHIPGDIASFTTQHGAEGAVLTTTSQCEFRSLVYL